MIRRQVACVHERLGFARWTASKADVKKEEFPRSEAVTLERGE
jgi:hypothetical protein